MRRLMVIAAAACGGVAVSSQVQAADNLQYFQCSTQVSSGAITTVYSSGIFAYALAPGERSTEVGDAFKNFLNAQGLDAGYANCSTNPTVDRAYYWLDNAKDFAHRAKARFVVMDWSPPSGRVVARGEEPAKPKTARAQPSKSSVAETRGQPAPDAAKEPAKTREQYEAEWQTELKQYEADKRAWEAKVAAQKAEEARQQAAHAAAQDKAANASAEHERKMEAHRRRQEEYNRIRQQNIAELARHSRCVGGDRQACADIEAGKPALEAAQAEEARASTDDDARMCVTEPVVSASNTFKGQTQAVVFNGCDQPVDVRICLLRSGGWNCGMTLGLKPQDRWTWTSFETQGGIFWDARVSGSNRQLSSPGGN